MTFIPNAPVAAEPVANDGFFPDIDPAACRAAVRIDDSVLDDRLRPALITAMTRINRDLLAFKTEQATAGHASLAAVPADQIDAISILISDYNEAVYSWAKASLLETYSDIDSTVIASSKVALKNTSAEDFKRRSFEAVRRIMGQPRSTIELI